MSMKPQKIQFNGGELSPWLRGRLDIAKFDATAELCRNFIPLTEGALKRRGGTRFVAKTPEDDDVHLKISPVPAEALVLINGEEQNEITVARGDTVNYEVRLKNFVTVSGKVMVHQTMELRIVLVSKVETCTLGISPVPFDATVKIGGYERFSYTGKKNETVDYIVYRDGYKMQSGSVLLDENKSFRVVLENDEEEICEYGNWGNPVAFVSCTMYGCLQPHYKCFLIRFENGYLPILFDERYVAPSMNDINPNSFVYTQENGYETYVKSKSNGNQLAIVKAGKSALYYTDLNNNTIRAFKILEMVHWGWPSDEYGELAVIYRNYDGSVSGSVVKVYYKGKQVFEMKGFNHG